MAACVDGTKWAIGFLNALYNTQMTLEVDSLLEKGWREDVVSTWEGNLVLDCLPVPVLQNSTGLWRYSTSSHIA